MGAVEDELRRKAKEKNQRRRRHFSSSVMPGKVKTIQTAPEFEGQLSLLMFPE